jgi:hypothetical protein
MLQSEYERGTKDSDVLETHDLTDEVKGELVALAGKDSEIYRRRRIYLDFVASALPFLPASPARRDATDLNAKLRHLSIEVLDVVDVVVTKLKRFSALDQVELPSWVL